MRNESKAAKSRYPRMFVYLAAKINKTYQHEIQRILRKSETCARAGPVFINNTVFLIYIDIEI